jgi:CheY-like chemotaxis protein/two-component sensor histidine kinase
MSEADGQVSRFLAVLAHELRSPLAPIRNALHLIHLTEPPTSVEHAEHFAVIERQVDHLIRLVDDLLDVSRIRHGKIELQKERVDLAIVIAGAVETTQHLITARRQHLTVSLPVEPLTVEGDVVRLVQIVANLLNNAAKYTPEGGQIWVTATTCTLDNSDRSVVAVRVRDNGIGILAELQGSVFDLFTPAPNGVDVAHAGLGIGLTLVRTLVEMHGGTVGVSSAGLGCGSEFMLTLPLICPVLATPAPVADEPPKPAPCRRVLIVDDNDDSATTLARLVRLLGNDTATAATGRAALTLAADFQPEIIFLDIGLPDIDGHRIAMQLRQSPRLDDALIVALTGYGTMEDRRLSWEAGFNAHLVKPVDLNALRHILAQPETFRRHPQASSTQP